MNKSIPARVQPLWNTTAGWAADTTTIPELGEPVAEQTTLGFVLLKLGDGVNTWPFLSYVGGGGSTPADGTYIGFADPTTNPGVVVTDSFYFCGTPGTYSFFITASGAAVMPGTATLGILAFKIATGFWTYRTLNSASAFTVPDLQAVTSAGRSSDRSIFLFGPVLSPTIFTATIANATTQLLHGGIHLQSAVDGGGNGVGSALRSDGALGLFKIIGGVVGRWLLRADNITTNNSAVQVQDRSGTMALCDPRYLTLASTNSLTYDTDNYDVVEITALAVAIAINAPTITGTPKGRCFLLTISDNSVVHAITWNAAFIGGGTVLLPTFTSGTGKQMTMQFQYLNDGKCHIQGVNQE